MPQVTFPLPTLRLDRVDHGAGEVLRRCPRVDDRTSGEALAVARKMLR